jgi:hypothetical protein
VVAIRGVFLPNHVALRTDGIKRGNDPARLEGAGVTVITSSSRKKRELVTVRIDLRIRWTQFCRRVDGIGHLLFSVRTQRYFHEAGTWAILVIRQRFRLLTQLPQAGRMVTERRAPTILFFAIEIHEISLSIFGRKDRLHPAGPEHYL